MQAAMLAVAVIQNARIPLFFDYGASNFALVIRRNLCYTTPNTMAERNGPDTLRERISAYASDPFFDPEQKMSEWIRRTTQQVFKLSADITARKRHVITQNHNRK